MCCIWSSSGFCYYLIDFYVKYFPGNVFINKGFFGLCDAASIVYIKMLEKKLIKVPLVIRFTLFMTIIFSLFYSAFAQFHLFLIPIIVGFTRLQTKALFAYSYHVNQFLFPTLMKGTAFSMTNFVSRPLIGMATFISEYTSNPIMLVTILTTINIGSTFIIKEPEE